MTLYTAAEAAERLGITACAVRAAIRRGDIRATAFGDRWMLTERDIERDIERVGVRTVGRRRATKRCPCGKNSYTRAEKRGFDCCKAAWRKGAV